MSGGVLSRTGNRLIAVADGDDADVLVREGQLDDALDGDAVVGEKEGMGHVMVIGKFEAFMRFSGITRVQRGSLSASG